MRSAHLPFVERGARTGRRVVLLGVMTVERARGLRPPLLAPQGGESPRALACPRASRCRRGSSRAIVRAVRAAAARDVRARGGRAGDGRPPARCRLPALRASARNGRVLCSREGRDERVGHAFVAERQAIGVRGAGELVEWKDVRVGVQFDSPLAAWCSDDWCVYASSLTKIAHSHPSAGPARARIDDSTRSEHTSLARHARRAEQGRPLRHPGRRALFQRPRTTPRQARRPKAEAQSDPAPNARARGRDRRASDASACSTMGGNPTQQKRGPHGKDVHVP